MTKAPESPRAGEDSAIVDDTYKTPEIRTIVKTIKVNKATVGKLPNHGRTALPKRCATHEP